MELGEFVSKIRYIDKSFDTEAYFRNHVKLITADSEHEIEDVRWNSETNTIEVVTEQNLSVSSYRSSSTNSIRGSFRHYLSPLMVFLDSVIGNTSGFGPEIEGSSPSPGAMDIEIKKAINTDEDNNLLEPTYEVFVYGRMSLPESILKDQSAEVLATAITAEFDGMIREIESVKMKIVVAYALKHGELNAQAID